MKQAKVIKMTNKQKNADNFISDQYMNPSGAGATPASGTTYTTVPTQPAYVPQDTSPTPPLQVLNPAPAPVQAVLPAGASPVQDVIPTVIIPSQLEQLPNVATIEATPSTVLPIVPGTAPIQAQNPATPVNQIAADAVNNATAAATAPKKFPWLFLIIVAVVIFLIYKYGKNVTAKS